MCERIISFEQKKAIFQSFHLQVKEISHGRVNMIFPASLRKGKIVATQLHPSGNGYVNGNYMTAEMITKKGYVVDKRGWINIKYFTKERLIEVIEDAIASMKY